MVQEPTVNKDSAKQDTASPAAEPGLQVGPGAIIANRERAEMAEAANFAAAASAGTADDRRGLEVHVRATYAVSDLNGLLIDHANTNGR